jgi:hypothetical protein
MVNIKQGLIITFVSSMRDKTKYFDMPNSHKTQSQNIKILLTKNIYFSFASKNINNKLHDQF